MRVNALDGDFKLVALALVLVDQNILGQLTIEVERVCVGLHFGSSFRGVLGAWVAQGLADLQGVDEQNIVY